MNFLKQNPSGPGVFQYEVFLVVVLSESMCIFAYFGPSSSPSRSFAMLLIISAFLLCSLGCHVLLQNCSASFVPEC